MKIENRESPFVRGRRSAGARVSRKLCSCAEVRAVRQKAAGAANSSPEGNFQIPEPLQVNQNDLCVALERAALAGGKTGKAARALMRILQPHLLKEEEDLLPTLGLLAPLARGEFNAGMQAATVKTAHLKARMFEIMREHVEIIEAARKVLRAARAEHKLALVEFTERLMLRAWTDEVVFYPAAVLIGEYLKLKVAETLKPVEFRHKARL